MPDHLDIPTSTAAPAPRYETLCCSGCLLPIWPRCTRNLPTYREVCEQERARFKDCNVVLDAKPQAVEAIGHAGRFRSPMGI